MVQLGTCNMIAQSETLPINTDGGEDDVIKDGSEILTKGSRSLWDEEW